MLKMLLDRILEPISVLQNEIELMKKICSLR